MPSLPKPIMRPDKVQGYVYEGGSQVDRHFYLHDTVTDFVYEADGYLEPAKPGEDPARRRWTIFFLCPCCQQVLRLDSTKKPIEVTEQGIETGEPLKCSYWLKDADGYTGPCPFRGEFQPPKAIEYGEVRTDAGVVRVKIDAWIRRAT